MKDWFITECTRGRESACEAVLARLGYPGAWHPTKPATRRLRASQGHLRTKRILRAWVPGYLFVPTDGLIAHHEINGWHGKLWLRVLAPGGAAYLVTDADMAQMRDVPKRLAEKIEEAKRLEAEALAAIRRPGAAVIIMAGPLSGQAGIVDGPVEGGLRVTVGPIKVVVAEDMIQAA